jgi:hypothetical protein
VLAEVLHRKRPRFIPLYDDQVRTVYQAGDDAPVKPPPQRTRRAWRDFVVLYAAAVQGDLRREADLWAEIAGLATDPPITTLRALDIIARKAGSQDSRSPRRHDRDPFGDGGPVRRARYAPRPAGQDWHLARRSRRALLVLGRHDVQTGSSPIDRIPMKNVLALALEPREAGRYAKHLPVLRTAVE